MDSSWAMYESPGRKPDWEGVKSLSSERVNYKLLFGKL